ncbi:putative asparagine-rich antigen [Schistosoma mansoni]|uniref:putative asparagine-rich antigen n=1 Tax=Schistosoma mansoni TaxID=6183 RepID=UPI00022DC8F0|nr:putative asparagine-rich antigen [Schistosoma mansoni]|eukprot:XP_018647783.1 putative asparagine-rich antigen [Schistosoma mansoni]
MKLQSVQNTSRTNIMRKKRERKHRSKVSHSVTLSPCLVLSSSLEQTKSINDELSEKRVDQRKERSRLAAQIRRNREGQSLMLIQNALPISSHVLGLNLIQQNSKSSNSINGTKQINQPSENNNMITPGTIGRGQKKTAYFNSTVSNTMTGFLTTTSTATTTETSSSTISNIPSAINLEKARVLRIAGHTLFLLNKLSSYLRLQAKLYLSLNSQSVYGMLIDSKEMRIAYATPALAKAIGWSWPVCNKISSFEDLTNRVNSIINDTEYNHNNTISNDSNDNNINGEVNQNNLLDPSIHILEDLQKSATNDKQDSSISFELHNNINIMQSEESLMELSDIDTTSSSLLNGSTSMKIPSLEQKKECIKSKSFQCHTYLNCALTIKMVQGNYTDCFDIEDQSDIVDYSYLEFIHPDDLQNVITIFTRITHTNSLAWISPYRVSAHNKTVNNNTEKSYRWIRSLVSYDKMKNIFICSNQFLGSCELYDCAVGSNQRLLSVTFENSFKQFELKINNTTNNSNISSQNFMRTFNYDPSNESSINSRYHQQPKSKQVRISNSSSRSVRLKKSPTSLVIKNSNIIKPIKLFPFQSSQYIKQQSGQGYNQIISGNNQIRSIRLLPFTTTNNNKVPCLSYLNTHLYDSSMANDNSYTRQTNSVLNISTTKSSLYHSPSNVSSVPYYVKSMLPVVNYTSSSSKKLIFLSSASSLPSSISINKLQTFNTSNISRNKFRNDNKRGKYIEYSAISQDNNPTSLHYKNNIPFSDSSINDLYNQMIFGPDNNKTSNPIKLTVKTVCNDHQWNSGDNWSPSLIDNSSPHSVYSSHGSSTSISLSPNEQNLTDLNVSMQMETTVSELLESIPLSNKLSYDNDGVQMNIDFNGNSYDSNTFEYEDSELSHLDSDFESSENFTGFQPDLISDSDVLNSPV